ncbi:MAG TPA: hypothetical protein DDZ39_02945 [Flavobacteriaceae bacterium]|nr:hypothetical protein [Flavobacteriaceae bacterium]
MSQQKQIIIIKTKIMKKVSYVFAVAVLSLISTTAFAQEEAVADVAEATTTEEVVEAVATEATPQERTEIELSELPEAVATAVTTDFAGYTADKAFKSSVDGKDIFTIQLSKDGEAVEANYTAEGKVVQ